jgi:hypothetical protein
MNADPWRRIEAPWTYLLMVDGNDVLVSEARLLVERITSPLPDDSTRRRFVESEPVARLRSF